MSKLMNQIRGSRAKREVYLEESIKHLHQKYRNILNNSKTLNNLMDAFQDSRKERVYQTIKV